MSADRNDPALDQRKRALRGRLLARRAAVSGEAARAVGDRIAVHLAEDRLYAGAASVAIYAASGGEPDLRAVFDRGRAEGKTLLLSRCRDDRQLELGVVERWDDLVGGRFGLLEPPVTARFVPHEAVDVILVPCVAVDARGGRLGRGGGWYDRMLAGGSGGGARLVAVAHAFQCVERVPVGEHDRPVDGVATEAGLRWVRA